MTDIVLGPVLRWVGTDAVTVWLETDGPCDVRILDHVDRTFHVAGHHYALVLVRGLTPGSTYRYEVEIDGVVRWPRPDVNTAASTVRTLPDNEELRVAFGSCRVAGPRVAPMGLDRLLRRYDPSLDAMVSLGRQLMGSEADATPHLLLLLGDQVYADNAPESTRRFMRRRRDTAKPPGEAVADFEEYTRLYRDSWSEPAVRWLLSAVPSAMIFDDHELVDDWRTSRAWVKDAREQTGWDERLAGSLVSYWIYQHLGNLGPQQLATDSLYRGVRDDEDGYDRLHEAVMTDDARPGSRWSFVRDLGPARLVVVDARATRVLDDDERDMFDETEWRRVEQAIMGAGHVLLASSVPVIYAEGFHNIQAWSERVAAGAWGARAAGWAEKLRRSLSLSGWPAFEGSFDRLMKVFETVGTDTDGAAPKTITILSGDVHHGYVARVWWPHADAMQTVVHQVVSSPLRNPLRPHERAAQRLAGSRIGGLATRALGAAAGISKPEVAWERLEGLEFADQVSTLSVDRTGLVLQAERTVHAGDGQALEVMWRRRLT